MNIYRVSIPRALTTRSGSTPRPCAALAVPAPLSLAIRPPCPPLEEGLFQKNPEPFNVSSALVTQSLARHESHRRGFIASRSAASSCLSSALGRPITFLGAREDAHRLHGAQLSLTHEDSIAGAVTWPSQPQREHYAIDVADVCQVDALRARFPQFGKRWLSSCCVSSSLQSLAAECFAVKPDADAELDGRWWRADRDSQLVLESCILAQHWSIRECCVKLLGIPNRSFDYGCVACDGEVAGEMNCNGREADQTTQTRLPNDFVPLGSVHWCKVTGKEADVFASLGLHPLLRIVSWVVWVGEGSGRVHLPYAVTIASCERQQCTP